MYEIDVDNICDDEFELECVCWQMIFIPTVA